mmetsp:Transcript_3314/g.5813  ORF Transcript_3314/g.5813 Transcript_3314/m.5813 type:complete len:234 (-) Transcript_3314:2359-3060(-)
MLSWRGKTLERGSGSLNGSSSSSLLVLLTELLKKPSSFFALLFFLALYSFLLIMLTAGATNVHSCLFGCSLSYQSSKPSSNSRPALISSQSSLSITTSHRSSEIQFGNADHDVSLSGKWILGHFISPDNNNLRHSKDCELKWARNSAGTSNGEIAVNRAGHSMGILIYGRQRYDFGSHSVVLQQQGDYVIWAPGVAHTWTSELDSLILTLRWPSVPNDQEVVKSTTNSSTKST